MSERRGIPSSQKAIDDQVSIFATAGACYRAIGSESPMAALFSMPGYSWPLGAAVMANIGTVEWQPLTIRHHPHLNTAATVLAFPMVGGPPTWLNQLLVK